MALPDGWQCGGDACPGPGMSLISKEPGTIRVVLISETPPADPGDRYDAPGNPLHLRTTLEAFRDAGLDVGSLEDLRDVGIGCIYAVRCPKPKPAVPREVAEACSRFLEEELERLSEVKAYLLMGDVAIRGFNALAIRTQGTPAVPRGSTYRVRQGAFFYRGARVFPSYLQAGPCFYVEKSKRAMIAQDLREAMLLSGIPLGAGEQGGRTGLPAPRPGAVGCPPQGVF